LLLKLASEDVLIGGAAHEFPWAGALAQQEGSGIAGAGGIYRHEQAVNSPQK